jgi:putative membrane protein insertion efficiency factor
VNEPAPSSLARPLVAVVRWYQVARDGRLSPCRFVPSCSTYAIEALQTHGAVKGSALAVGRLCRCHPWGGHGFDPVPPKSERRKARAWPERPGAEGAEPAKHGSSTRVALEPLGGRAQEVAG